MDTTNYRPAHFQDVNSYLVLQKGQADLLMDFLKQAFGAEEHLLHRDPNGRVAHGEYRVGDTIVEFGEGPADWHTRASLHYFVQDVDAVHARAVAAGGKELSKPIDHDYGERSSAIEDPCGNRWYIARVIPAAR